MTENPLSYLGTGWSFPPSFSKPLGAAMSKDVQDIEESLKILLGTAIGERFLNPKFGFNLSSLMFESMTTTLKTFVTSLIERAILYYEPRIDLHRVELNDQGQNEGRLEIVIEYSVRATSSRFTFVYPIYLDQPNRPLEDKS